MFEHFGPQWGVLLWEVVEPLSLAVCLSVHNGGVSTYIGTPIDRVAPATMLPLTSLDRLYPLRLGAKTNPFSPTLILP